MPPVYGSGRVPATGGHPWRDTARRPASGVARVDLHPQPPGRTLDARPARRPGRRGRRPARGTGRRPSADTSSPAAPQARRRRPAPRARATGPGRRRAGARAGGAPAARPSASRPGVGVDGRGQRLVAGHPGLDQHPAPAGAGADHPGTPGPAAPAPPPPAPNRGASRCWSKSRKATRPAWSTRWRAASVPTTRRAPARSPASPPVAPSPRRAGVPSRAANSSVARVTPIRSALSRVESHDRAHRRAPLAATPAGQHARRSRPGPPPRRTGCSGPARRRSGRPAAGSDRCG